MDRIRKSRVPEAKKGERRTSSKEKIGDAENKSWERKEAWRVGRKRAHLKRKEEEGKTRRCWNRRKTKVWNRKRKIREGNWGTQETRRQETTKPWIQATPWRLRPKKGHQRHQRLQRHPIIPRNPSSDPTKNSPLKPHSLNPLISLPKCL